MLRRVDSPLSAADLPASINPATFNFTLAWIEYLESAFRDDSGLFIRSDCSTCDCALSAYASDLVSSIGAALLVAFLDGKVGKVVYSEFTH
ncbi:MAG: hypothetical protein IPH59_00110 [bacterium]|nr:hypothetical protein [bacterium]